MKLRHAAASPFVRKVMVVVHEPGLVDRIALVATSVRRSDQRLARSRGPADEVFHPMSVILLPSPNSGSKPSKTSFWTATHPAVGAKSGVAIWRKIALPAPGTTGSIL
jgi:hypothetical protein